jgi:hypothetical protein
MNADIQRQLAMFIGNCISGAVESSIYELVVGVVIGDTDAALGS